MQGLTWHDDTLHVDGVRLPDIARAVGTPCFVYSAGLIRERLGLLAAAFDGLDAQIRFAIKANSNAALMRLVHEAGAGFDLVSGGELQRATRIGASPSSMVFAGVGKQEWEIELALRAGIGMFNVESEGELARLRDIAHREGLVARVALRVNPDVHVETHEYITTGKKENKFGIDLDTAAKLVEVVHGDPLLQLVAYHVHLGSLLLEAGPYLQACERVMQFIDDDPVRGEGVQYYDVGGGFGSSGPFSDRMIDLATLGSGLRDLLQPRGMSLLLEPGRLVVGDAGVLLTEVVYIKRGTAKDFYVVDAGMNDLIRPALYAAEHEIVPVVRGAEPNARPVDVVGPVCETADFIGKDRVLPSSSEGDLIAVLSAGAYGSAMASNYNSRAFAAEVLCDAGAARLIRRRQRLEDLWRDEVDEGVDLSAAGGDPRVQPEPEM